MNEPIINPAIFYLIDALNGLDVMFMGIVVALCCVMGIAFVIYMCWLVTEFDACYENDVSLNEKNMGMFKKGTVILLITVLVGILIPSEKTMYTMWVTKYITPQNIEMVGESAVDIVDYIFEKVDELQEGRG